MAKLNWDKKITRDRAIALKCRDCTANQMTEIKNCPCTDCPLWIYRPTAPNVTDEIMEQHKVRVRRFFEEMMKNEQCDDEDEEE